MMHVSYRTYAKNGGVLISFSPPFCEKWTKNFGDWMKWEKKALNKDLNNINMILERK